MKKILLASTMLVGTTGFAAADVSFSGLAYTGVAYNLTTTTLTVDAYALFTAGMMTTTDGGLEAGASITILGAGQNVQKGTDDAQFGANDWPPVAGVVLDSHMYLSGNWGKVAIDYDTNADDDATTPGDWDIQATYTNSWGNFGIEAYAVWENNAVATTSGDFGLKASYDFGNYGVWAAVGFDNSDADGNKIDLMAGASATFGNFGIEAEGKFDIGTGFDSWVVSASYSTGPYSLSAFVGSDTIPVGTLDYGVTAGYNLGGGVGLEAGFRRDADTAQSLVYAGVRMAF